MPSVIDFASDVARLLRGADTPRRLTRTERAACELALGVLRCAVAAHGAAYEWRRGVARQAVHDARLVLRIGSDDEATLLDDMPYQDSRYTLARLALYLRALLRADRGDLGPRRAGRYDTRQRAYDITRRMRPLWQVASEARHA